jgi:hypothetical protein
MGRCWCSYRSHYNKRKKVQGAIIGGVAGAGIGAGTGAIIDGSKKLIFFLVKRVFKFYGT